VLVRRRWPLAVLMASAAILQLYYQLDYPGIYPAVPLSVALATAWAAGHRLWSLLVAGLFVAAGSGSATRSWRQTSRRCRCWAT
jgi:hypothetical protein